MQRSKDKFSFAALLLSAIPIIVLWQDIWGYWNVFYGAIVGLHELTPGFTTFLVMTLIPAASIILGWIGLKKNENKYICWTAILISIVIFIIWAILLAIF
ncbi:hypothetical protein ACFL1B_00870 [Nanoarchaeota archaeon]